MNKRLYRSEDDQIIAGVCAGIAEYFDIDPSIVRIIFALALFGEGFGFLLYIILWLILPPKSKVKQESEETIQQNKEELIKKVKTTAKGLKKEYKTDTKKKETK